MKLNSTWKAFRGWLGITLLAAAILAAGCADPEMGRDASEYFGEGTYSTVNEEIEFTDEPYDIVGEVPIQDLRDLIPEFEFVWYGFSENDVYPVSGDCDPQRDFDTTEPAYLEELPATIEGVVTMHPRYFMKVSVCGTEERYYGSYVIQDQSTGIHVLKDSRIGEFDVGDRVRLRVRALIRSFGTYAVLAYDEEEVLTTPSTREPVYYQQIERNFQEGTDNYEVFRIVGRVALEATNQNFNEMIVESEEESNVEWLVSLDRELGTRGVAPPEGALVQLTGPVFDSFGMRMLITNLGQIEVLEE